MAVISSLTAGAVMTPPLLFTFGKYFGQPVTAVRADPGYGCWLLSQPWFRDRHPNLRRAVARQVIEHLRTESEQTN
jgi:hypothetical protein